MIGAVGAMAVALVLTVLLVPLVILIDKKLKVGQPILSYVDNHSSKKGTPTFGGIAFVLAVLIASLIFIRGNNRLAIMCVVITIAYGLVGFLDDFIKIKSKHNEGLTALQKIVFQVFISVIVSTFAYADQTVGREIVLPFTLITVDVGYFAIPYYMMIFLAFTNAVNLTDGLDGLASKSGAVFFIAFAVILYLFSTTLSLPARIDEMRNLTTFALVFASSLIGFLLYNSYPAKIFMGDTGSLAIGGAIGAISVLGKISLYSPVVGCVFVFTCISDIIQVVHYKRTKKRVFLMAPFHHHLERKGWHENKISDLYAIITLFLGICSILLTMIFAVWN